MRAKQMPATRSSSLPAAPSSTGGFGARIGRLFTLCGGVLRAFAIVAISLPVLYSFLPEICGVFADRTTFLWRVLRRLSLKQVRYRETVGGDWEAAQARNVRRLFIRLGPTFIKIGQSLASRPDLVPVQYLREMERLQDDVPSFAGWRARWMIRRDLKRSVDKAFASLTPEPIAAASIGQVYRGTLADGTDVAVKVRRPGIKGRVLRDAVALHILAKLTGNSRILGGLPLDQLIDEFKEMILKETDFHLEVQNAETFRQNLKDWKECYVPRVFPELCGSRVITMEFVGGVKLTDAEGLRSYGAEPLQVLEVATRVYLKQLIDDGFFHADPHPGNLRYLPDGRLAFFDFGMVGDLGIRERAKFLDLVIHIGEKDMPGVARSLAHLGFVHVDKGHEEILPAIEEIVARHLGAVKGGMFRFHELSEALSEIIYRYPFTVPPRFAFVLRAILTLEGIGLFHDPNFSFYQTVKPHALQLFFLREAKDTLIRLFSSEGEPFNWDRTKKVASLFWKYVKRKLEDQGILSVEDKQKELEENVAQQELGAPDREAL
ncbi:MAG: AarF/ABC1/UbiB kinase family protein [Spirochaetia bacterium]|nr:AarF/ABC1/UbiB kinase family protein [Spirochaetia bacterium]